MAGQYFDPNAFSGPIMSGFGGMADRASTLMDRQQARTMQLEDEQRAEQRQRLHPGVAQAIQNILNGADPTEEAIRFKLQTQGGIEGMTGGYDLAANAPGSGGGGQLPPPSMSSSKPILPPAEPMMPYSVPATLGELPPMRTGLVPMEGAANPVAPENALGKNEYNMGPTPEKGRPITPPRADLTGMRLQDAQVLGQFTGMQQRGSIALDNQNLKREQMALQYQMNAERLKNALDRARIASSAAYQRAKASGGDAMAIAQLKSAVAIQIALANNARAFSTARMQNPAEAAAMAPGLLQDLDQGANESDAESDQLLALIQQQWGVGAQAPAVQAPAAPAQPKARSSGPAPQNVSNLFRKGK